MIDFFSLKIQKEMSIITHKDAFNKINPKFFDQNIDSLQKDLQSYVEMMGERLKIRNNIEEYTYDLNEVGTNEVCVYGRIYAGFREDDPTEKLTDKNAEIQFVPKFEFDQVHKLKFEYQEGTISGLFRGQIIAAKGIINTNVFCASQIFTDCRTEDPEPLPNDFQARIIAVSGPYESESFDLIDNLNERIRSHNPDLVIFFGPFASKTSSLFSSADCKYTYKEYTEEVMRHLGKDIEDSIFIPSNADAFSIPTVPRKFLELHINQTYSADPTFITLKNKLEITATANDLQFLIGQQYNGSGLSRREEIPKQIAHQCSACPVMDSSIQNQYLKSLVPTDTPHIFLISTRIFSLHKDIDGTHVIYIKQENKSFNYTVIDIKGNEIKSEVQI